MLYTDWNVTLNPDKAYGTFYITHFFSFRSAEVETKDTIHLEWKTEIVAANKKSLISVANNIFFKFKVISPGQAFQKANLTNKLT